jgi:preprotein translocase subunit SecD
MNQRKYVFLGLIVLLVAVGIWINLPSSQINLGSFQRDLETNLGLDLRGGLQVLMEVQLPEDEAVSQDQLEVARQIMESRSNALGVSEVTFQTAGTRRLVGEFPGATNVEEVLATIKQTGLLEFVEMLDSPVEEGTRIQTDYGVTATPGSTAEPTTAPGATPSAAATPAGSAETGENPPAEKIYQTVMTGSALKEVGVTTDQLGRYVVSFTLTPDAAGTFGSYTTAHQGQYLGIVLDKTVISAPVIENPITDGNGQIQGSFTVDTANALAVQLRYGALPIPLGIVESRVIGPTLGEDSLQKSLRAGIIGLIIIVLFMALYYRLPGGVADIAILIYALLTLALFKLIPVTLTLPGIAGVMLSMGSALDANILIFERLKEELRSGKTLQQSLPIAWRRAWPSIRDSNIATLITCAILFWFGSSFGATIVKGFAVTLALGVLVSLFTALVVTRTFLTLLLERIRVTNYERWFGI